MLVPLQIVQACISIHNANVYEVLSESEISYICQPYLFFHTCGLLNIPCLADILVFVNASKDLSHIHKYFTLGSHILSFASMITLEIVHICLYNCVNVCEVVSDIHKYFTFSHNIFSFKFMTA